MDRTINAKELRATLAEVVRRVRRGDRYTVLYRNRPAFRIVPADGGVEEEQPLEEDPLYKAKALGSWGGDLTNEEIDRIVYGLKS